MMRVDEYQVGTRVVQLVSPNDEPLGELDVFEAHHYPMRRHRAVSVWLFRRGPSGEVEVLWQLRSHLKVMGGLWANSACGNNRPGEGYLECAQRRLRQELGIAMTGSELEPLQRLEYRAYGSDEFGEHELDQVFVGWWSGQVNPNPAEVAEVRWLRWSETWTRNIEVLRQVPEAEVTLSLGSKSQLAAVAGPRELDLADTPGQEFRAMVAPWTLLMMRLVQEHLSTQRQ